MEDGAGSPCTYLPGAARSSPLTRHFVMVITSVLVSTFLLLSVQLRLAALLG